MAYDSMTLRTTYERTTGHCHICGKKLSFANYGKTATKGAWEVEHSIARANGGSDHGNNLYAACISCNRGKGTFTTRTARSWHGNSRAPLSKEKRKEARQSNAILGGLIGGVVGFIAGPWGAVAGAAIGARMGYKSNPDR